MNRPISQIASRLFARIFAPALLVVSGLLWSNSASASWLGLADGDYAITLTSCTSGSAGVCSPLPATGALTISGAGASFMSITFDGVLFQGNPVDLVQDPFITPGDIRERSSVINLSPYSFFSLLHEVGSVLTPPLPATAWLYCESTGAGTCSPNTYGAWQATRVSTVPEPESLLLVVLALAAMGFARRHIGRFQIGAMLP